MPAEHPQEPQLGQVCLPWEIWGTCDLRHWSSDGKVEVLARTSHPVIDRGKAPGEYEPSGWTDGHVRLRGTHEFDQCVDRQHQLVELGVDHVMWDPNGVVPYETQLRLLEPLIAVRPS